MDNKKEMLNLIENLANNDYNDIESFRTLLLTLLLFYDNNEQDNELWEELIKTIRTVVEVPLDLCLNIKTCRGNSPLHRMNRENLDEILAAEDRYDNMTGVLKSILSQRVMCPKSEGKNFKAYF